MVMPSPLRPGGAVLIRPWSIADVRLAESAQPHLVPRMICAGVRNLTVEVAQSNRAARGLALALAGPDLPAAYADGMIRYQISLTMAPPAEGRSGAGVVRSRQGS
jgi:hypothetical protein